MNQISKMDQFQFDLNEDEEIVFDEYPALLTTKRLLVFSKKVNKNSPVHDFNLSELYSCQIENGGEFSRISTGFSLLLLGAFLWGFEIILHYIISIPDILDLLLFVIGGATFMYGLWQVIKSLTRKKPHTMVIFEDPIKGGEIVLSYPGIDNEDAATLVKNFDRLGRNY